MTNDEARRNACQAVALRRLDERPNDEDAARKLGVSGFVIVSDLGIRPSSVLPGIQLEMSGDVAKCCLGSAGCQPAPPGSLPGGSELRRRVE
jgi:hypothetical protein